MSCSKQKKQMSTYGIGDDCTLLRRHMQAFHQVSLFLNKVAFKFKIFFVGRIQGMGEIGRFYFDAP